VREIFQVNLVKESKTKIKPIDATNKKELIQKAISNQRLFSLRQEPIHEVINPDTDPQNNDGLLSKTLVINSEP